MSDHEVFEIPAFTLQSGVTLNLQLAYRTYGTLAAARDNAVLVTTCYGSRHPETEYFFGDGRAIDPKRHYVIIANLFGNGCSSSPSNTPMPHGRGNFPRVSFYDNIVCQHRLVTEHLGIDRLRLVTGFSMGGAQAFEWGAHYADMIDAIVPICGAARCSAHNKVMIDGPTSALKVDAAFNDGWYDSPPMKGMLAFGRVYAGWLFSQDFYRHRLHAELGLPTTEDAVRLTQDYFLKNDANDLLAMAATWQNADISANPVFNGDFAAALAAIRCRAIVMPGETDLYFRVADNEIEVAGMPNAELRPIRSLWGHAAGFGVNPADQSFIDQAFAEVLD